MHITYVYIYMYLFLFAYAYEQYCVYIIYPNSWGEM